MHRWFVCAVTAALALGLGACGSSAKHSTGAPSGVSAASTTARSGGTGSGVAAGGSAITISTTGDRFVFATSPVKSGSNVIVKNLSAAQHTVSADTSAGGFDVTIDAGQTARFSGPARPGAYRFHCNIHTYMTATLTVT